MLSRLTEAVVESHVDILLELPAVAHTHVRQYVLQLYLAELREDGSGTSPEHNTVALPHMLTQLHLRLYLMVVAIASLVVATHRVAIAELREHRPLHIAEVELRTEVGSKRGTLPQMRVAVDAEVGSVGVVFVADELRAHELHELYVHASLRRSEVVARVVYGGHAGTEVERLRAFATKQVDTVELSAAHIVGPMKRLSAVRMSQSALNCACQRFILLLLPSTLPMS